MAEKLYGNRWKVIGTIGEGGQGQVLKVQDVNNGNKVFVLKKLKNINRIERFKAEIDAIQKLRHTNIVNLIDFDLENEKPYLVTEYCEGGELKFEGVSKLSNIEKLKLFSEICRAIGFAHENGVIHRDIKPANILLRTDGKTPVITDFGICFDTEEGLERLTETIEQVGARFYMAPELRDGRAENSKITFKSDVYSLGKLLYWMFRGKVMDRENFSEREWELRKYKSSDHTMYFVYDIFEKTIVLNSSDGNWSGSGGKKRFEDANVLAEEVDRIIFILERDGRYLDTDIPQRCLFCVAGEYKIFAIPTNGQNLMTGLNSGFPTYPKNYYDKPPDSFCYVCENCGNIQFFNSNGKRWRTKDKKIFGAF